MGFDQGAVDEIDGQDISPSSVETDTATVNDDFDATGLTQLLTDGSTNEWLSWQTSLGSGNVEWDNTEADIAGDNTAQAVNTKIGSGSMVVVNGEAQGSGTRFEDIVLASRGGGTTIVASAENGSPGPRSYSQDANTLEVAIDDSGTTYDCTTHALKTRL